MQEIGFKLAFSVEDYLEDTIRDDPRYVKYIVRLFGREDGRDFESILPYHKCTEEDWNGFPPPDKTSADVVKMLRTDPKRGLYCIDIEKNINIYGNERNMNYQRLEIIFTPCNYLHRYLGYKHDRVHPECVANLAKQIEYVGKPNLLLYFTEDLLGTREFGNESIKRQSTLKNTQLSEIVPSWINTLIERNISSDETQLLQLGFSDEREFY